MSLPSDQPPQVWTAVPNRSLGPPGRQVILVIVAATAGTIGLAAAWLGAWPVLPFAGLEVLLLALAFRAIGRHDGDCERLEVDGNRVRLYLREASREQVLEGHAPWARLVVCSRHGRCELGLRYAGRTVGFGRLLTDERRREWAEQLGRRLPVTRT